MNIYIYYRHADSKTVLSERPEWFDYEKCFKNLLTTIHGYDNVTLTIVMDGPYEDNFIKYYHSQYEFFTTNYRNSLLSYRALLEHIKKQQHQPSDLIYFLENDYVHVPGWVDKIVDLYKTYSNLDYVSLYDHNDKYFLDMYDNLVSKIFTSNTHHWRTTPSTCGSFIVTRKLFDADYE